MDKIVAERFAQEWIDAWNSHNLENIVSHYADEIEYVSPIVIERYDDSTGTIATKDKLKEYVTMGLANNPKMKFELIEVLLGVRGLTFCTIKTPEVAIRRSILSLINTRK